MAYSKPCWNYDAGHNEDNRDLPTPADPSYGALPLGTLRRTQPTFSGWAEDAIIMIVAAEHIELQASL